MIDFFGRIFNQSRYKIRDVAANYSVVQDDNGSLLTVTAAATITLPAPAAAYKGMWLDIVNIADVNMTIASGTADTLVVFNDVAADSVAFSTASEKVGAAVRAICNGSLWILLPMIWDGQTATVVTA